MNTERLNAKSVGAMWKLVFRLPMMPLDMTEVKPLFSSINSATAAVGQHRSIIPVVRARALRYARDNHPDPEMAVARDVLETARALGATF